MALVGALGITFVAYSFNPVTVNAPTVDVTHVYQTPDRLIPKRVFAAILSGLDPLKGLKNKVKFAIVPNKGGRPAKKWSTKIFGKLTRNSLKRSLIGSAFEKFQKWIFDWKEILIDSLYGDKVIENMALGDV